MNSDASNLIRTDDYGLENILDILILAQSCVNEDYLDRFVRLSQEHLKDCLDLLLNAKCVREVSKNGKGQFYEITSPGQQFLNDSLRKLIWKGINSEGSYRPVVSVIIPAFNEEGSLKSVVQRTHEALQRLEIPYEIIVIDDGSTDNTSEVACHCNVILVKNGLNGGKGHALQLGFQKARGSFIVTMDADGSHRPEEIYRLLYPLFSRNLDIGAVIGSRFVGKIEEGSITRLHLIGNRLLDLAVRLFTRKSVSDTQSGFRAYRRKAVEKMAMQSLGFEIEAEMIIRLLKEGLIPLEVPITCRKRAYGDTRVRSFEDGFKILKVIIQAALTF